MTAGAPPGGAPGLESLADIPGALLPPVPVGGATDRSGSAGRGHPRPTSRRGRAFVRRLLASSGAAGPVDPAHLGRRRRRVLTSRQVRRRRAALLTGMGVFTVAGIGLAVSGLSTVRHSTVGRYEEAVAPDEPGYQAYVVPTLTMGVLHRAADGTLAGVWLLALEPGDQGGTVIGVPPATEVPARTGEPTLAEVYSDDGAAGAAAALGVAVNVAVTEHVEVDDAQWAQLVAPVGAVEVALASPVGEWEAGPVVLEPGDVGPFLAAQDDGESDLERLDRQQAFWDAWLLLVATRPEPLPGEVGTGIGRFVRAVAGGEGTAAALPVTSVDGPDGTRFRPAAGMVDDFVSHTVAYPAAGEPGGRVRVRLLNGTTDPDLTPRAARALVAAGAEIVIAGNASSFDVDETRLVPADAAREPVASWVAARLGGARVAAPPSRQDDQVASEDDIDVTVILGQDAQDLIER